MPTLHEVQQAMRRSIVDRDDAGMAGLLAIDGIAAVERLDVYRANYAGAVIEALRLTYPAINRLVGAEFFDGCAGQFVRTFPPRTPWLYAYGGEFGDFLAQFPSAAGLPYLGDVARLEWAINGALHARDAARLDVAELAALAGADPSRIRFELHPAIRLPRAGYPVDAIWRAVLAEDDEALGRIDLSEGPVWLLVERGDAGIEVSRLNEGEWRFSAALLEGARLDRAIGAAEGSDVSQVLAAHFAKGRIAKAHFDETQDDLA